MNYKIKGRKCCEWTVVELKKALVRRKEPVTGKKEDLCNRLRESLKHRIKSSANKKIIAKKQASVKILPLNVRDPLFVFYVSLYYQNPNSEMALKFLSQRGLTKNVLNKHTSDKSLINYLT